MFTDFTRTVAAIALTVVFSATAVIGAVGPATQTIADHNSTVAAAARLTA